jgi:hypothetical protein
MRFEVLDGVWREENGSLSREEMLSSMGIGTDGSGLSVTVEREGSMEDEQELCEIREGSAAGEIEAIMQEVFGDSHVRLRREACGPRWLLDLSKRLALGERIIFVHPGEWWRAVVELLRRREVQAIVVGPGAEARELGFCVLGGC